MAQRAIIRVTGAAVIGTLAVAVAGLGVATAANGGSLVLGKHNSATKTTTIRDSKGTPLALLGKKSKPPLKVNSSKMVKHLNASQVGGRSAGQLGAVGSGNTFFGPEEGIPVSTDQSHTTSIVKTAKLTPGTYLVSGTAEIHSGGGDTFCYLGTRADSFQGDLTFGPVTANTYGSSTESAVVTFTRPVKIGMFCYAISPGGTQLFSGTIAAQRFSKFTKGTVEVTATTHARSHGRLTRRGAR